MVDHVRQRIMARIEDSKQPLACRSQKNQEALRGGSQKENNFCIITI